MALMDILGQAQEGRFFANAGTSVGLDASAAAKALSAMCPAIAAQLKAKSAEDPQTFDSLVELLEDEGGDGVLDDREQLAGGEAIRDGNSILDDIYGSREAAIREMRRLAGDIPETSLGKLAAIGATAVLGALSRSHAAMPLTGAAPLASSEGGGLLGTIVSELVKGAVQGAARTLAPRKRRRRKSYSSYFGKKRKRRTTSRKRSSQRTPSLEDIFGEILGTRRR